MHTAPPNLLDNGCNQNYLCSVILINQHTKLTVMKNLLIASAILICSLFSQASFAGTGKENPAVLQAFGNDFAAAKDVGESSPAHLPLRKMDSAIIAQRLTIAELEQSVAAETGLSGYTWLSRVRRLEIHSHSCERLGLSPPLIATIR